MTKMIFKNLPDKSTPAKAENLNKLNNLAIDSTLDGHDEECLLIKTKNIFNGSIVTGGVNNSGTLTNETSTSRCKDLVLVEPNTQYIFSNNGVGVAMNAFEYDSAKSFIGKITSDPIPAGVSFTTSSKTKYISFFRGATSVDKIQIEEGTQITPFEEYVTSKIYANKEKYTDTINVGTEPNNSGLWVEHSKNLLKIKDTTYTSNGLTASVKDGKITITGTATSNNFSWSLKDFINLEELQALTLNTMLTFSVLDIVGTLAKQIYINTDGHDYYYQPDPTSKYVTKSLISKIKGIQIFFFTTAGTEYNIAFSPMLEKGSTAHEFEPYTTPSIKVNNNGTYETIYSKGIVLYNGGNTGSSETITLSDSAVNYDYIEIFYRSNDNMYGTTRIYDPDGKYCYLNMMYIPNTGASSTTHYFKAKKCYISGTSITSLGYSEITIGNGSYPAISATSNNIYICKVVGYGRKSTDTASSVSTLSEE